jgi:hypothetical protein
MKVLKRRHLLVLALLMASCDPMQHTKCDDALVKQVASPDRTLEIQIYNRSCAAGTGLSTYAVVHDPKALWSWPRRKDVCILAVLSSGYHPMEAVWRDSTHIEISSPDELTEGTRTLNETCGAIAVSYNVKLRKARN